MICFATCAFGLSGLVRDELLALELPVLRVEDARVFFEADRPGVIRANLWPVSYTHLDVYKRQT